MGRPLYLPAHIHDIDFGQLAKREPNPRRRVRLLGLAYLQDGASLQDTASAFQVTPGTVRNWLNRLERWGLEGLVDQPRSGRPGYLNAEDEKALKHFLSSRQQSRSGGRLRGQDIQQWLQEALGVFYHLNSVYRLLDRLGWVWISARSCHPHRDPDAQVTYKKTSAPK